MPPPPPCTADRSTVGRLCARDTTRPPPQTARGARAEGAPCRVTAAAGCSRCLSHWPHAKSTSPQEMTAAFSLYSCASFLTPERKKMRKKFCTRMNAASFQLKCPVSPVMDSSRVMVQRNPEALK